MIGRVRPQWLRKENAMRPEVVSRKAGIDRLGLHTVCVSARCPNLAECFAAGNATFLILGDRCTRHCAFCAVEHGTPLPADSGEGKRIAGYMEKAGVRFAVITSVTRDDLADGGAAQFEGVVGAVKKSLPSVGLELLIPDFRGSPDALDRVLDLPIEVLGHNMETVESLYNIARTGADYGRSLRVLERASAKVAGAYIIKSGVMVGLGETREELLGLFKDLADSGVSSLTIGQYLRPARENLPVARYVTPSEFNELADTARSAGIPAVLAGPYVRSSYMAERLSRHPRGLQSPYSPRRAAGSKIV
jgi:lipoic acid synthetase